MTDYIVVYVTAPEDEAVDLAKTLVEERLVACVNIVPGLRSLYWWKGKVEDEPEVLCIMKTRSNLFESLRDRVRELLRACRAFIFPGLEDFGIAPVEAMAAGRPVVAYAGGGALDTVEPGVTGELYHEQTAEGLANALAKFDWRQYDSSACRAQAEQFSAARFRDKLLGYLGELGFDAL